MKTYFEKNYKLIVFALLIFWGFAAYCQLGFNGSNWSAVHNYQTQSWWDEATEGNVLVVRHRADKGEPLSYLFDLNNELNLEVIYTANIDSPNSVVFDLLTLNAYGVNVVAVEADNEYYSETDPKLCFSCYRGKFEPVFESVLEAFPNMPFMIFAAPRPSGTDISGGRSDHAKWNNDLASFLTTAHENYAVVGHIYLNGNEIPNINTLPSAQYKGIENVDVRNFYQTLFDYGYSNLSHYQRSLDYFKELSGNRPLYITEWGIVNTGDLSNVLAYDALIWAAWNIHRDVPYFLHHNGQSPTNTGVISLSNNKDLEKDLPVKRTRFFAWDMLNDYDKAIEYQEGITISENTYLWYMNIGQEREVYLTVPEEYELTYSVTYVGGKELTSGSGYAGYMASGSTAGYDIEGIQNATVLPKNSFGYITATVTKKVSDCIVPRYCKLLFWLKKCKCS